MAAGADGTGQAATGPVTATAIVVAEAATTMANGLAVAAVPWPRRPGVAAANPHRGHLSRDAGRPGGGVRWALDPEDDLGCVHAMLGLNDPPRGLVACLAAPGAPWTVLARDLLLALGKSRAGIDAAGTRARAPALLELWLRAEQIAHLVVLRAHLLPPATLRALEQLAARTSITFWHVAHGPAPEATPPAAQAWSDVFAQLSAVISPSRAPTPAQQYATVRDLAGRAARSWRLYTERTMLRRRHVRPGCDVGALLPTPSSRRSARRTSLSTPNTAMTCYYACTPCAWASATKAWC